MEPGIDITPRFLRLGLVQSQPPIAAPHAHPPAASNLNPLDFLPTADLTLPHAALRGFPKLTSGPPSTVSEGILSLELVIGPRHEEVRGRYARRNSCLYLEMENGTFEFHAAL